MKIQFDNQAFDMQNFGGISKYFYKIYNELKKTEDIDITSVSSSNYYLVKDNICLKSDLPGATNYKANLPYSINYLLQNEPDIYHATFFYVTDIGKLIKQHNLKTKFVLTIHDVIPEIYNWQGGTNEQIIEREKILDNPFDAIICPSETTKKHILEYYDIDENMIFPVYHGIDNDTIDYKQIFDFPYILFVGGRFLYKNFLPFAKECIPFLNNHPEYKIVYTGSQFNNYERQVLNNLGILDKCVNKFCTDEELASLYHYAFAFVYPSSNEGFGMPVLECWQNKGITLLNDIDVFREIAGDTSLFFNINKHGELSAQLEYLYNLEDKSEIINKQDNKLKQFSWEKTAVEHLKIYQSLL